MEMGVGMWMGMGMATYNNHYHIPPRWRRRRTLMLPASWTARSSPCASGWGTTARTTPPPSTSRRSSASTPSSCSTSGEAHGGGVCICIKELYLCAR